MRRSTLWKSGVLSLLLLGFALSVTFAQQRTVTGTVTSEDQGALPGVNIVVQGTTQGAVTDGQGNYTISVPGDDAILVFSFIGYSTQAVPVGSQTSINVTLAGRRYLARRDCGNCLCHPEKERPDWCCGYHRCRRTYPDAPG